MFRNLSKQRLGHKRTLIRGRIAMDSLESRVTDLEIQLTHQIKTIDELNSVIVRQQEQIEKIQNFNNFLIENLKESQHANDPFSFNQKRKPPYS